VIVKKPNVARKKHVNVVKSRAAVSRVQAINWTAYLLGVRRWYLTNDVPIKESISSQLSDWLCEAYGAKWPP